MFLLQTTKYALRVLMKMAENEKKIYSANYLHEELNIPRRYLMRLLTDLSKYGYIVSTRGRIGGFTFKIDPNDVSLADVVNSLQGYSNDPTCFFGNDNCKSECITKCAMHEPWENTWTDLHNVLSTTTIGSLGNRDPLNILD